MAAVITSGKWREPTSLLPLRWGGYRPRYIAAVGLIIAGGLLVQTGSVYSENFLTLGIAAHVAGWLILPARGPRRVAVAIPSALLVGALLLGSVASVLLVGPLACWLYLRQRPALSYLALLMPLTSGLVLAQIFPQYGNGIIVAAVSTVVLIGAAWLARSIAGSRRIPSHPDAAFR